ncbi:unnamed protein product [Sphagnum troendelagicum]|uniref:NPH3 domain-containing protein n=1 Tax=Sphagnum troendelagicum TaxID=128251 RepID=A0ABP0UXH6_9BRYO
MASLQSDLQPGTPPAMIEKRMMETESAMRSSASYLEVDVNAEQTFIVHKTPLLAHCGRLVEAVKEATMQSSEAASSPGSTKLLRVQVRDMPGGAEAFEMAARFCFNDADICISSANVAMLRCAAEFLDMTEALSKGNLTRKTEDYLRTMVFWSWEEALVVLRSCKEFQSAAEKTQLVQRCVNCLADKASSSFSFAGELNSPFHAGIESYFASYLVSTPSGASSHRSSKAASETWWFEDLSTLPVHLVARVVKAMMANRTSDHRVLAKFLLHYLRSALPVLGGYGPATSSLASPMPQHKSAERDGEHNNTLLHNQSQRAQRQVIQVVVSLLACLDRSSVSCRSLLGLRRIAIALRAGKLCRRELERMIGAQLDKATLDNILIPALPPRSSSLYDVDLVLRLLDFFLKDKAEALMMVPTPVQTALTKVGGLMDKYLAEIAADVHLRPLRFLALAESLPDYARESDDGLYRAVDIYLEAHPSINEADASRLFKVINCHKLGAETCKAAVQNSRFPPSFLIQVALVQQAQQRRTLNEGLFCSSSNSGRDYHHTSNNKDYHNSNNNNNRSSSSPPPSSSKHSSSRMGQQTVVHVQCSHFEFTLRQIQQDKKKTTENHFRAAAVEQTEMLSSPLPLQHIKTTESSRTDSSFDSANSSCKRSRVEMISSFHRLKQLFHSKSRQH